MTDREQGSGLPPTLTDCNLAYLAGLIDGEGHIGWERHKRSHRLLLEVTNTDLLLLEWLRDTTGVGSVRPKWRGNPRHKPCYRWRCLGKQAATLLRQIEPYAISKKQHIRAALSARDIQERHPGNGVSNGHVIEMQPHIDALRVLTKRGIVL